MNIFSFLKLQDLLGNTSNILLTDLCYIILGISLLVVVVSIFKLLVRRGIYRYLYLIPTVLFSIIFLVTSNNSTITRHTINEFNKGNKEIKLNSTKVQGQETPFISYQINKDTPNVTYSLSLDDQNKLKTCNNFKYNFGYNTFQFLILGNNILSTPSKPSFEIKCY